MGGDHQSIHTWANRFHNTHTHTHAHIHTHTHTYTHISLRASWKYANNYSRSLIILKNIFLEVKVKIILTSLKATKMYESLALDFDKQILLKHSLQHTHTHPPHTLWPDSQILLLPLYLTLNSLQLPTPPPPPKKKKNQKKNFKKIKFLILKKN